MDEIYVAYVDDDHVDTHDYDDTTDDDHDNNNGLAWSGPVRPGSGPGPVRGPGWILRIWPLQRSCVTVVRRAVAQRSPAIAAHLPQQRS